MKKYLLVVLSFVLLLQYSCIVDQDKYKETDIFEEYETQNGFTILHIPPVLFKIIFSASDESEGVSKDLLNKIDVIKLMFFEENEKSIRITEIKNNINSKVKEFNYNLLTKIAEEKNDISIYVIDREKVIKEVLIIIVSDNEYIGINLVGELTKEDVMNIYKAMDMQNIQEMEN